MFDTRTLTLVKKIDVGAAQPDGLLFDAFNDRVYIFSHPTKDATVIDARDGTVLGTIDLGGVPEQGVVDGRPRRSGPGHPRLVYDSRERDDALQQRMAWSVHPVTLWTTMSRMRATIDELNAKYNEL